jgi:alkylhydroperoxidase family enzyme
MQDFQALLKATQQGGVLQTVLDLVHLRTSQINGCRISR